MARREKQLRVQAQQVKAEREAFEAARAQAQAEQTLKARLKQDPLSVLRDEGIYDTFVSQYLNAEPVNPQDQVINELRSEIKALKDSQDAAKKSLEDQQSASYQQAVNQVRSDIKLLVNGNPKYSTIEETGSDEAVVALIEQTFNEQGILLTNEEAADEVETYLIEEAYKMSQLKKVQQRLTPPPAATKLPGSQKVQTQQPMRTLTRESQASTKPLSSRERAIAAFKGQLK
jgi:hypothetical protein